VYIFIKNLFTQQVGTKGYFNNRIELNYHLCSGKSLLPRISMLQWMGDLQSMWSGKISIPQVWLGFRVQQERPLLLSSAGKPSSKTLPMAVSTATHVFTHPRIMLIQAQGMATCYWTPPNSIFYFPTFDTHCEEIRFATTSGSLLININLLISITLGHVHQMNHQSERPWQGQIESQACQQN